MISRWTKDVLGYSVVLKDMSNGMFQIMLKDDNGNETNIIDNGYGVSQVLPIVTEAIRLSINGNWGKKVRRFNVDIRATRIAFTSGSPIRIG